MMLKYSKKLACLLIAGAMAASLMACGSGSSSSETASGDSTSQPAASTDTSSESSADAAEGAVKLSFWDFHENEELEFFQKHVDQYNSENPDISIELVTVPNDDYRGTKMATGFASGTGPDIFEVFPGSFLKYANSDVLAPLNDAISPEVLADFSPSSIEGVSVGDKILAIPFEIELLGVYYDVDVLEAAGVTPPKTWAELKDAASALATDTMAGYTMEVVKGGHQLFEWYPFLWQTGNNIFNADKTAAAINQPGVIENLKLKREMYENGSANIKPSRGSADSGVIGDGETALHLNGTWAIAGLERNYPEKNFNVVPIPVPEGGSPSSVAGGWKLAANSTSPNADKAVEFVTWMFAGEDNSRMTEWCTDIKFAYAPRLSVLKDVEAVYNEGMRAVFTSEVYGTEQPELRLPPEVASILEDMLQACYYDSSVTVEDEVAKAEQKINEFLATYEGVL